MKAFTSFLLYALLLPGTLYTGSCAAGSTANETVLVGSTPGDDSIKAMLNISRQTKIDFIRWNLVLGKANAHGQNTFVLHIAFGEVEPNTPGHKNGGEKREYEGTWSLQANKNSHGEIYSLQSSKFASAICMAKLNDNLFHLLSAEKQLMIGNGGWSYTLSRREPKQNTVALPALKTAATPNKDTATQLTFIGRTPCSGFAQDNKLAVAADCFKLKWKLILNRDPQTLLPTTYVLRTTFTGYADITGSWNVIKGIPSNPDAVIYRLYQNSEQRSFSLLAADENVLLLLNSYSELYTGNADFSFTLNKRMEK